MSYIDKACRIHVNDDPVLDPDFDPADPDHTPREFFTLQDAHLNVLALVKDANAATAGTGTGGVIERYEFTPYGKRIAIDPDNNVLDPSRFPPPPRSFLNKQSHLRTSKHRNGRIILCTA